MGWIPALFARKVLAQVERDHAIGASREVDISAQVPRDADAMMTDVDFFTLLEEVSPAAEERRAIPLLVGASMRCDEYGAFGLAFKAAVDLGGAYRRVERYGEVVTSISNFRLNQRREVTLFEVIPGHTSRLGLRLTNELALAAAVALSREVCARSFNPVAVHLSLPAPRDRAAFDDHFRCPICFDAPRDALEVTAEQLAVPNRLGDASTSSFLDAHLARALMETPERLNLAQRVRAEVTQALSEGAPTLSQMARRMGMSPRTLQRKLGEVGVGYRALVTDARRALAERLLRCSDHGLVEVAFLTGFADQSAFSRAFKRWCGQTPRTYRLASRR